MAYNRRIFLTKVIEIQNITLEHTRRGASQRWIYTNLIAERFYIAESTYNRYLAIPAKAMLKKIGENDRSQLKMF